MSQPIAAPLSPVRVLLVDDEEIVRYGLNAVLRSEPSLEVVGEAQNGEEAIALTQSLQPDVILMDVNMPVMDGVTATWEISQVYPQAKILILTTHTEDTYLLSALQQGAVGYLLKNTPPEDFVTIIQAAHKGYMQLSPAMGEQLSAQLQPVMTQSRCTGKAPLNHPCNHTLSNEALTKKGLTPREQDVLKLIAEGASNREISEILHIVEKTVKNHVSNLLKRTELRDRTQLAIWANRAQRPPAAAETTPSTTAKPENSVALRSL